MKWVWWTVGIVAFLLMLYTCALPGDLAVGRDSTEGLAGTYTVNGEDNTGAEYSGTVVIAETDEAGVYVFEWIITGSILRGTGSRTGDTVEVRWETVSAVGGGTGTTIYTINDDGTLVGVRAVDGFDETGTETIYPEA